MLLKLQGMIMTDNTGAILSLGDKVVVSLNYSGNAINTNNLPSQTLQIGYIVKFTTKQIMVYVPNIHYVDHYKVEADRLIEDELILNKEWETLSKMFSTSLHKEYQVIKI